MSVLMNGIAFGDRRARAKALTRYREILLIGDAAKAEHFEEMRLLMIELGKAQDDVRNDLNYVKENRRLAELAAELPACALAEEKAIAAEKLFCDEADEKIKALQAEMKSYRVISNQAQMARIRSYDAQHHLRDLKSKAPELFA